jgi:hypothetical protein
MPRSPLAALLLAALPAPAAEPAPAPRPAVPPVVASVESTLPTDGGQIRQFALDGDPATAFASKGNAGRDDYLTVALDGPVAVRSIAVATGWADSRDALAEGTLEVSADGDRFERVADFAGGTARAELDGRPVKAIRVRPAADLGHPLVVREVAIGSYPAVATFRYPVEVVVDVTDAPDLAEWARKAARACERAYPMICDELMSDGFKPLTVVTMTLRSNYKGVAAASRGRITGSAAYFRRNPADVGAMVHETAHCVQLYRGRGNPGWLVEGVADYVRFFKYEPGKAGRLNPERARYDGSYRVTAAFLAYLVEKYDRDIVRKLNAAMREGRYAEGIWKELTGKGVEELNQEWRRSLPK